MLDNFYFAAGTVSIIGIALALKIGKILAKSDEKSTTTTFPRQFTGKLKQFTRTGSNFIIQSLQNPAAHTLSLIIPAYNEEKRLKKMLMDALPVLEAKMSASPQYSVEIILVDDGSRDATCAEYARIIKAYHGNNQSASFDNRLHFKLLKLARNSGKGCAVSEGFLAASGENILFADADGSTDFSSVNRFESLMGEYSTLPLLICGSRAAAETMEDKSQVKRSLFRLFLMKAFHAFLSIFGVRSVADTQCGFKMMNRPAARLVIPWIHISGWIFDVEMILLAEGKGVKVMEVPVPWKEMDGTKLSLAIDSLKMARDLLRLRMNYFFGIWKSK